MKTIAAVLLFVFASSALADQAPESKEAKVRRLLVLMNVSGVAMKTLDTMRDALKTVSSDITDEYWATFKAGIKPEEFVDMLAPVYMKNLDEATIDGMIAFYQSPAGRSFVAKQSVIMDEALVVGQQWGMKVAAQALRELQKKKR